jgi:hypothetical protein
VSVIVGGAIIFGAGMVCLFVAVWKRRTRPHAIAAAQSQTGNNAARKRVATTKVTVAPHSASHRAPAPPRESYYAHAPPSRAKGRPMGWYSVEGSFSDERFWDGRTWTARRQLVEGTWAPVPLAG